MDDLAELFALLYNSLDEHSKNHKKPLPDTEERALENGKRTFSFTIGGGEIDRDERLRAKNRIRLVLHNIANLKDNVSKYLEENGINNKLVDNNIDASEHLKVITDLVNKMKHGEAKRYPRSGLDPKMSDVQNSLSLSIPVTGIFFNPMDGRVSATAEAIDSYNNYIFGLGEMVEECVSSWEDFFIKYIPEASAEILERRELKRLRELRLLEIQQTIDKANNIFENYHWETVDYKQLNKGMIVRCSQNDRFSNLIRGIVTDVFLDENSVPTALVFLDSLNESSLYSVGQFNWQSIICPNSDDFAFLVSYYNSYPIMISEVYELR